MHRLHGCTCWLLVAYTVRHASTGIPIGCVTYVLTTCSTPHMPTLGKGFGISFSQNLCQHASNTRVSSYLNIPQASLLHSCLHEKAKHALTQVQACSLYIHFITHIISLACNPKTLNGPITFSSGLW